MDGELHRSDAVALDTTSVCVIAYGTLRERLSHSSRAVRIMMDAMSRRLAGKENVHLPNPGFVAPGSLVLDFVVPAPSLTVLTIFHFLDERFNLLDQIIITI